MMHRLFALLGIGLMVGLSACGGGGGDSSPTAPAAPTVTPSATIESTGNGTVEVHPSTAGFAAAIRLPVRIRETGGGTADWTYARYSALRNGVELERKEITSTSLIASGISRITARQDSGYILTFHVNSSSFDSLVVTLGFADLRDGRQFTTQVPFGSFTGVVASPTPLYNPGPVVRLQP